MKKLLFLILLGFICTSCTQTKTNFINTKDAYFGLTTPGLIPEIFAPNIVSTGMSEINACFSPDYTSFFYSITLAGGKFVIMSMDYDDGKWSGPEVADFSGEYSDADPFITSDGKWLYFISKRPIGSKKEIKKDYDIWRVQKIDGNWGNPERLSAEINSEFNETYPSLTQDGKLYFSSERIGTNNKDIYSAERLENGFKSPVRLSDTINSHWEGDIFISPQEDYMIFASHGRAAGSGLYITFQHDGQWSIPQKMNKEINTTGREFCPIVSPDGKYFFFTSNRIQKREKDVEKLSYKKIKENFIESFKNPGMGRNDIYWVDSEIIEQYRDQSLTRSNNPE